MIEALVTARIVGIGLLGALRPGLACLLAGTCRCPLSIPNLRELSVKGGRADFTYETGLARLHARR